jgi:hypothetical protein
LELENLTDPNLKVADSFRQAVVKDLPKVAQNVRQVY